MERRDLLIGTGALVAAATARTVLAQQEHAHHTHREQKYSALVSTATDCVKTGAVCIDHCLDLFAQGDVSTAECARSVSQMRPVCDTLAVLAAQNSKLLSGYAKVAAEYCKYCEDECRKHEKEHEVCKSCAEACAACGKECQKAAV